MDRPWNLDYDPNACTIGATVGLIGEKWTFLVLREAFNGIRRFETMQQRIGASRQILSDRLAHLVREGILSKVPYRDSGQRSRMEYRLTEKGLDLYPIIVALMGWGDRYANLPGGPPALLTHRDCGAPVRLALVCEEGHELESARDVTPLPGPGAQKIA